MAARKLLRFTKASHPPTVDRLFTPAGQDRPVTVEMVRLHSPSRKSAKKPAGPRTKRAPDTPKIAGQDGHLRQAVQFDRQGVTAMRPS
jgi:hypothetical protein